MSNFLQAGQSLETGQYLTSTNGYFYAIMQSDGNFCVYRGSAPPNPSCLWDSHVTGPEGAYFASMQSDGNFCVYSGSPSQAGAFLWGTADHSLPDGPHFVKLHDDGKLCVYKGSLQNNQGKLWDSGKTDTVKDCSDITDINFDVGQATFQSLTPERAYHTQIVNNLSEPQTSSISGNYSVSETSSWSNSLSIQVGVKTSFKTGLPIVVEGTVEISTEITDTYTWNGSDTTEIGFGFNTNVNVPANSRVNCDVLVSKSKITLPYTLAGTLNYNSGGQAQGTWLGTYTGKTSGDVNIIYSPADSNATIKHVRFHRVVPSLDKSQELAVA